MNRRPAGARASRALLLVLGALVASCRPPAYVQPTEAEPHAILKIRHNVIARRGPMYSSEIRLGTFAIDSRTLEEGQAGSDIIHLRIRPEYADLGVGGTSFHTESRQVMRYRSVQEPYTCYHQQCSYGSGSNSCHSVSSTCYRSRQQSYWTTETVTVVDDRCGQRVAFAPQQNHVYLMQFDYLGENQCQLECFEQVPTLAGGFELVPCPPAAPPIPAR